ncbi:MAG: hypothetical protein HY280_07810 [Nitrospinae bacterium]|nr:hypothetical protein [Nitrospinota bacterium]
MTDFLFATPGFFMGMVRALDLGSTFNAYNASKTPSEADALAFYNDFKAIGDDLRLVMKSEEAKIAAKSLKLA